MTNLTSVLGSAVFLSAVWITAVNAEDAPTAGVQMELHVTDLANAVLSQHLDDKGASLLKSVAHQHTVAQNFEGFRIDEERSKAEMQRLFPEEKTGNLADAERQAMHSAVTMGYGIFRGGQSAIAAANHEELCRLAKDEIESTDGDTRHIVLVKQ